MLFSRLTTTSGVRRIRVSSHGQGDERHVVVNTVETVCARKHLPLASPSTVETTSDRLHRGDICQSITRRVQLLNKRKACVCTRIYPSILSSLSHSSAFFSQQELLPDAEKDVRTPCRRLLVRFNFISLNRTSFSLFFFGRTTLNFSNSEFEKMSFETERKSKCRSLSRRTLNVAHLRTCKVRREG